MWNHLQHHESEKSRFSVLRIFCVLLLCHHTDKCDCLFWKSAEKQQDQLSLTHWLLLTAPCQTGLLGLLLLYHYLNFLMRCNSQNLLDSHLTVICQSSGEGLSSASPDHPHFSAVVQLERTEKRKKKVVKITTLGKSWDSSMTDLEELWKQSW